MEMGRKRKQRRETWIRIQGDTWDNREYLHVDGIWAPVGRPEKDEKEYGDSYVWAVDGKTYHTAHALIYRPWQRWCGAANRITPKIGRAHV